MKKSLKRGVESRSSNLTFLITLVAVMTIIMAACTGTSQPPEATPTSQVSTPTEQPQATAEPPLSPEPTQEPIEPPTPEATATTEPTQEPVESPTPEATATTEPTQQPTETPVVEPTQEPMESPTPEATPDIPEPPPIPAATFDIIAPWSGVSVDTNFVTVWAALDYEDTDEPPIITINGENAIITNDGAAYLNVDLIEGENVINVTSIDSAGIVVSDDIIVTYTPPAEGTLPLAVFYPPNGLTVVGESILVIGGTSSDAEVTVNGEPATVDVDGGFIAEADLLANEYMIEIAASGTNAEGQPISTSLLLQLEEFVPEGSETPTPEETPQPTATPEPEATPEPTAEPEETPEPTATPEPEQPMLTTVNILSPGEDAEVETPVITVLLQVLDAVLVRVNNELVNVSEDDYIETEVVLTEGENTIEVTASNFSAGISESATFTVTYDPPSDFDDLPLSIYYPSDGIVVNASQVRLVGGTVSDAMVEVNGDPAEVSDFGTFSATVDLEVGENEIEVYAADDSFETRERTETIVVTYEP